MSAALRILVLALLVLALLVSLIGSQPQLLAQDSPEPAIDSRIRPVAAAFTENKDIVLVASEKQAAIFSVDMNQIEKTTKLFSGFSDGAQLSSIESVSGERFVVSDFANHEIVLLQLDQESHSISEVNRCNVAGYPKSLQIRKKQSSNETWVAVGGLWSRQVSIVQIVGGSLRETHKVNLDFSPGPMVWLDDMFLLVADAFSDELALVDTKDGSVEKTWRREGHRIGGLAAYGDDVWFSDIKLNRIARTVTSDIHWGLLVSNEIFGLNITALIQNREIQKSFPPRPLGGPSEGKGDPTTIAITNQGKIACLIQGVGQLAIGDKAPDGFNYVEVGNIPVGLTLSPNGETALVCNPHSDEIRIINLILEKVTHVVSLESKSIVNEPGSIDRGESLFFNASLSHDSWISCNTCHVNGHSSFLLTDSFSDQSFGNPKQVISLLNTNETLPLAWNGSMESYESQITHSIESTMQSDTAADPNEVKALAAFVQSLVPPPSLLEARNEIQEELFGEGRQLFSELKCTECHASESYTSSKIVDVDLKDELGQGLYNPPSLLGVSQRQRFFHDGRASSLEEVLVKFAHPKNGTRLTEKQLEALVHFLNAL